MTDTPIHQTSYRSFVFGSSIKLSRNTLDKLISMFELTSLKTCKFSDAPMGKGNINSGSRSDYKSNSSLKKTILSGRGKIKYTNIPETGDIVIKEYKRGGLTSYFNKNIYIKLLGEIRPKKEFIMLSMAKKAEVNVPRPLIYVKKGSLFYRAWLITKKINDHQNFAELSIQDRKRAMKIFPEISSSIKRLIKNRIYHVDLHPGNILIDADDENYIIDFDKALYFRGSVNKLRSLYQKRWARAVLKYDLPNFISDLGIKNSIENHE